jgi:hypothetical protein
MGDLVRALFAADAPYNWRRDIVQGGHDVLLHPAEI